MITIKEEEAKENSLGKEIFQKLRTHCAVVICLQLRHCLCSNREHEFSQARADLFIPFLTHSLLLLVICILFYGSIFTKRLQN